MLTRRVCERGTEVNEEFAEHSLNYIKRVDTVQWCKFCTKKNFLESSITKVWQNVRLGRICTHCWGCTLKQQQYSWRTHIDPEQISSPIITGNNAEIEDRVTFHALKGMNIKIGTPDLA